jgi:DNA helicase-2/ATP-dependent DNA helicase PcrA
MTHESSHFSVLDGLNGEQRNAVRSGGNLTLVNACAGSGKTATATAKVSGWVKDGVEPDRILMLTFTRKAAGEMKARIAKRLGVDSCPVSGGTYHATALRMMRDNPLDFGLEGNFGILDDDAAGKLWKKALRKTGGDPKEAGRAAGAYGLAVNLLQDPEQALAKTLRVSAPGAAGEFVRGKEENRLLDFDDILMRWRDALSAGRGGVGRWSHVMVDEFQDNSELQYDILKRLGAKELFVVGDPNQCIYSFRGSAPKLMARFSGEHPECKVHTLALNYRSGQSVLDVANDSLLGGDRPVTLKAAKGDRGYVHKYAFGDHSQEADFIQRGVLWRLKAGTPASQIAVLFRSGHQSSHIEMALRRGRIPYRKYGGISITEAADVKDFLAILKVWHNPLDRVSRLRVATLFPGVGEKGAEKAIEKGEPRWPVKAQEAGLWVARADAAGWPEGVNILARAMAPLLESNYPDDHEERAERVEALADTAREFSGLADFLDHYATGDENGEKPHPEDCITLSTIHSSKGLEWDDVFLTGAGGSQIPSRKAEENGQTEEERRLLYVAITRARKFLSISYPEFTPRSGWQTPTPFLPPEDWKRGG